MKEFPNWRSLTELRTLYDKLEPGYDSEPWRSLRYRGPEEMELESCEFIYAVVRLMKPDLVVESGAGYGLGSAWIGYALQANGHGHLITHEQDREFYLIAKDRLAHIACVEVRNGITDCWTEEIPQLVVLDSRSELRRQEIGRWRREKVVMICHDAHRTDYNLPKGITFMTYRGLWIGTGD